MIYMDGLLYIVFAALQAMAAHTHTTDDKDSGIDAC